MSIKVEGHTNLYRDEESHAIVNTDTHAYHLVKKRRELYRTQRDEINNLKNEVSEIKQLLLNVIEKVHG